MEGNFRVAVCDDNREDSVLIQDYLLRYSFENNVNFTVDLYDTGQELLAAHSACRYQIIFLDMELTQEFGIEVAKRIRLLPDREVRIIFVTNFSEEMSKSFSVQASEYLIKPISYEDFVPRFSGVLRNEFLQQTLCFSLRGRAYRIPLSEVFSIKTLKKPHGNSALLLDTQSGTYEIRGRLRDYAVEYATHFVQISRSELIPIRQLYQLKGSELTLYNGTTKQVTGSYLESIRSLFLSRCASELQIG